ncbi:hypothetical protein [Nostoc sp.]
MISLRSLLCLLLIFYKSDRPIPSIAIAHTLLSSQRSQCDTVRQPEHLPFTQKRRRWRSVPQESPPNASASPRVDIAC